MNNNEGRIFILKCFMGLIGIIFIARLFDLQIINGEAYRAKKEKRVSSR